MHNATTSSAEQMPISVRKTIKDTVVRDDVVPQLARRVRSGKSTWVVYLKSSGAGSKVTLGTCHSMPIARAREIAAEMVAEMKGTRKPSQHAVASPAEAHPRRGGGGSADPSGRLPLRRNTSASLGRCATRAAQTSSHEDRSQNCGSQPGSPRAPHRPA